MSTTTDNRTEAATTRQATRAEIRKHWGHGRGNRRVRIRRSGRRMLYGEVHYYGSTDDTDRQHDYWHYAGEVTQYRYAEYSGEVYVR